jgi:hypothetical protein
MWALSGERNTFESRSAWFTRENSPRPKVVLAETTSCSDGLRLRGREVIGVAGPWSGPVDGLQAAAVSVNARASTP